MLEAAVDNGLVHRIQGFVSGMLCNISRFVLIFLIFGVHLRRYCFFLLFHMSLSNSLHLLVIVLIDERDFELFCVLIDRVYGPLDVQIIAVVNLKILRIPAKRVRL